MSKQITKNQRIVGWDMGIHDLSVCVVETDELVVDSSDDSTSSSVPVPHIIDWEVVDLCSNIKVPMDRLVNELINFWFRKEDCFAAADLHVIEIQFHNPKMRALSAALQAIIALRSEARIIFMGSDTKFTICRSIGVDIEAHPRGGTKYSHRALTKRNAIRFCEWILMTGPTCKGNSWCTLCAERGAEWHQKWRQQPAKRIDDMADSLGLAYTAIVKYWRPSCTK